MSKVAYAILLVSILAAGSAAKADTKILDHHVASMKSGNLEGILSDYAPNAVVVVPPGLANTSGVFVGADTRKLFSVLTDKDHLPGNRTMETRYERVSPDTTLMYWVQFKGTPKETTAMTFLWCAAARLYFRV